MRTTARSAFSLVIPLIASVGAIVAAEAEGEAKADARVGASLRLQNLDEPGEGFNDPTPADPVAGNPGTTVGEQRRHAFERAAAIWATALESDVEIVVAASFDPLPCDATTTWLGFGGASAVFSDFPRAPHPGVLYPAALANKLAGEDLDPGQPDLFIQLNSSVNGDPGCLNGSSWYHGFDGAEPADKIDLVPVILHELGHGLGVQTFVDRSTGELFQGMPDHYLLHVLDTVTQERWSEMTDAERVQSAVNFRKVVWSGPNVREAAAAHLVPGTPSLLGMAPASVVDRYLIGEALFGPPLTSAPVLGELVYLANSTGRFDACAPYAPDALLGKIGLVDRGACGFALKVRHAQQAGALAVVVTDNVDDVIPVTMSGTDPEIVIRSVFITRSAGNRFKAALAAAEPTTVSFLHDLSVLRGADEFERVMLHAPRPVIPASSILHFDHSLSPDSLMEPTIARDLTDDLGLAIPLMRDLGW